MNIIPLDKQPSSCPACGHKKSHSCACNQQCMRVGMISFADVTDHSKAGEPHVHVSCGECGFTFLAACSNPKEVERLL